MEMIVVCFSSTFLTDVFDSIYFIILNNFWIFKTDFFF